MSRMKTLLLILATSVLCFALEEKCPQIDIKPCTCKTYLDGACILTCTLSSQSDIDRIADIPNHCNGHIHFVLVHSKISGIPARLWKILLSSKTVDISIKHSGIEGLIPTGGEDIPEVYTPGAAVIKIDHVKVDRLDWKQLSKFHSEGELTLIMDDIPLEDIGSNFPLIAKGRVHKVNIDNTGLREVKDGQFAAFKDINSLSLQNNKLTSVSRSIMPVPANKLEFLHLNGNRLTTVPEDLFKDMPALRVAYLRDNQIISIPQDLFKSISSKNLQRIDLIHNQWECNCSLMWIVQNTNQRVMYGVCTTPSSMAGEKISNLPKLLKC